MGWSGGREKEVWKVWLADIKIIAKKVVKQSMFAPVHEWYRCFYCQERARFYLHNCTSLPKRIMPILSSHHSIARNRLNY